MKRNRSFHRAFTHHVRVIIVAALIVTGISGALIYSEVSNARYIVEHYATGSLLSPELCLPFERYDAYDYTCIAECKGATACGRLEDNYRRTVNALSVEDLKLYYGFYESAYDHPFGHDAADRYNDPILPDTVPYATYTIENGVLESERVVNLGPNWTEEPDHIWKLFTFMLPKRYASYINEVMLLDDPQWTLDALAWVQSLDAGRSWTVAINASGMYSLGGNLMYRGDTTHTFVHEIGHIITLNDEQIDPLLGFTCATITLPEGCARPNSYIARFVKEFWPHQYGGTEAPSGIFEKGMFVTGYAADNPAEDMAETWTAFVILPRPTGNSIAEQKILSLYRYPELISARSEIRANLGRVR